MAKDDHLDGHGIPSLPLHRCSYAAALLPTITPTPTAPLDAASIATTEVRILAGATLLHGPSDVTIEPGAGDCETILA